MTKSAVVAVVDVMIDAVTMTEVVPISITQLLASGRAAVRHAAALLGQVTHAANNCPMQATLPNGDCVVRLRRDSTPKPASIKRNMRSASDEVHEPPEPVMQRCLSVESWIRALLE